MRNIYFCPILESWDPLKTKRKKTSKQDIGEKKEGLLKFWGRPQRKILHEYNYEESNCIAFLPGSLSSHLK